MFGDLDNFYDDEETLGLMKRYKEMLLHNCSEFFDLYEFECIINYFTDEYNFKEALNVVCLAIKQHPDASLMKLKYAQLLIEISRPGKALRILKSLGDAESVNYELYLAKGIAYNMTGKFTEAKNAFNSALEFCEDYKDELAYNIAQSYMQFNMYAVAVKYLILAYHYNKTNILVLYDLGLSYDKLDDPEKSLMYYEKYLDIDPFAEHVWNNMGNVQSRLGDYERASENFEYAISINPQFLPAYFSKADMYVMSGRIKEAIDVYTELLSEDNSNTRALCNLANCYISTGDFYEAMRLFKTSLDITNDCADALFGTGIVYFKQKRYTHSITAIKRAISVEPTVSEYWLMLGEVYNRTRKLNKAIDAYSRASELNPDDLDSRFACAQVFFRKRRIHEAIYMLMRIFEKHPENALVNYRLAAYYTYQQNLFEAQRFFKRALYLDYNEHLEMFRHFPKTRTIQAFRTIMESHGHITDSSIRLTNNRYHDR
jgi:tetratricopeptide (TPR) repeat protein